MIQTIVKSGKFSFQITDNTLIWEDHLYSRNFKIRDVDSEYVHVSVSYRKNQSVSATLIFDPDDCIDLPSDGGEGFRMRIQTLLEYTHPRIPSIQEWDVEDNTNIEGTNGMFIPLYYFSIAFNGKTWYEQNWNARQKDKCKHVAYTEKTDWLLHSVELKKNTSFMDFLQISCVSSVENIYELETYYVKSKTFDDFFQSMPKEDRCRLVQDWIHHFMSYYLKDVFSNTGWVLEPLALQQKDDKERTGQYYCPNRKIHLDRPFQNLGIDPKDV